MCLLSPFWNKTRPEKLDLEDEMRYILYMIEGLSAAISGMQLSALRMDISANDVANVNTPGYEQSDLIQVERSPGAAVGTIRRTPNPNQQLSGTDLAWEFGNEMTVAQTGYSANLKAIRAQDQMLGTLLDATG
jgi:flagellar basal body rod protein FlgG